MSKRSASGNETKDDGATGASGSEAATSEASAEGVQEGASAERAPETPPAEEQSPTEEGKKAASKKPAKKRDPSEKGLLAMAAMLKESNEGGSQAIAMADKIERSYLIEIIAAQFPDDSWVTEDVTKRVEGMETGAIALVVTWLALAWWNGHAYGQQEIMEALKAPLKNSPEDLAKLQAIEDKVRAENEAADAAAREENAT